MFEKATKTIAGLIPGTALNLAQQKRDFERKLKAQGMSRKQAMTATAAHFKKGTP